MSEKWPTQKDVAELHKELDKHQQEVNSAVIDNIDRDPEPETRGDQLIMLDCPPGGTRPGDLIGDVIKDTGLPERPDSSRFFGNWTWEYNDVDREVWMKARPILKERIMSLYRVGRIRYGKW